MLSEGKQLEVHNLITTNALNILALTEARVPQGSVALQHCSTKAHDIFHVARPDPQSIGGGVALIASRFLKCSKVNLKRTLTSFEFIANQFELGGQRYRIVNIYRPP